MLSRKALGTAFVIALISTTIPAAQATLFPGFPADSDVQALTIQDHLDNYFSVISNVPVNDAVRNLGTLETPEATKFCDEFNAHGCNLDASAWLSIDSILPVCATKIENCIKNLEFVNADGSVITAKFDRYFKGKTFEAPSELGMPGGSRVSLWSASGVGASGATDKFVVNTHLSWEYKGGQTSVQSFGASVYAVSLEQDSRYKDSGIVFGPMVDELKGGSSRYGSVTDSGEINFDGSCVAVEAGLCAKRIDFPANTRVKLSLTLSNKVTGWLHGRISKPEISVNPINQMFNDLKVTADVVDVPMMYAQYKKSEVSETFTAGTKYNWQGRGNAVTSFYRQYPPESQFAMTAISTLAESVKNTSAEVHTFWNVASIGTNSSNKCLTDTTRLLGFVTTNAMAYSGNAPTWNGESLEYKVSGLHFLPDGKSLTYGTYDLAMRSDAARCLYGFSNAPISASISVTGQDGEQKVATTVVNEKDGWLYLAAYGFTFSAPTVRVKLSQTPVQPPVQSSPTVSTPTTPVVVAKPQIKPKVISIKCSNGKTVKTVSGAKPVCPKGYKQK